MQKSIYFQKAFPSNFRKAKRPQIREWQSIIFHSNALEHRSIVRFIRTPMSIKWPQRTLHNEIEKLTNLLISCRSLWKVVRSVSMAVSFVVVVRSSKISPWEVLITFPSRWAYMVLAVSSRIAEMPQTVKQLFSRCLWIKNYLNAAKETMCHKSRVLSS